MARKEDYWTDRISLFVTGISFALRFPLEQRPGSCAMLLPCLEESAALIGASEHPS
jgi:hypothetical protein